MRLMLIGNPNAGKTTLFNHLTGSHRHVGNLPGVTVEYATGYYGTIEIIDLPGIYSLTPYSKDEAVAVEFLKSHPPDGIINCIDTANLRRSLGLTLALTKLRIPMVIAAGMLEEQEEWDAERLEALLKIPVFSAHHKNRWVPAVLIRMILAEIKAKRLPPLLGKESMEENFQSLDRLLPAPIKSRARVKSEKLDQILLHPLWGTLIFITMMSTAFLLIFHYLAPFLTEPLLAGAKRFGEMASALSPPLLRAIVQGIISGVGTVFSFLPAMLLLFFFLAFIEDCGYMVRICYLAEHIMAVFGLSGRSVVPLLIGFSCTVPAALAARPLPHEAQRRKTLRLLPFITCSAKLPVFGALASFLPPKQGILVIPLLYLTGIGAGLLLTLLSPKTQQPMLMELVPFRMPRFTALLFRVYARIGGFMKKAFSLLLLTSMAVAILQQLTPALQWTDTPSQSILAHFSKSIVPFFAPIRLDHWILICALTAGLFAKESALSVLMVLSPALGVFNHLNLLPFLAFFFFYPPCITALHTLKKESNSALFTITLALSHLLIAYLAAWLLTFVKI